MTCLTLQEGEAEHVVPDESAERAENHTALDQVLTLRLPNTTFPYHY